MVFVLNLRDLKKIKNYEQNRFKKILTKQGALFLAAYFGTTPCDDETDLLSVIIQSTIWSRFCSIWQEEDHRVIFQSKICYVLCVLLMVHSAAYSRGMKLLCMSTLELLAVNCGNGSDRKYEVKMLN